MAVGGSNMPSDDRTIRKLVGTGESHLGKDKIANVAQTHTQNKP